MILDKIQQSKPQCPRVLIAGVAGVGKSTLAASLPKPLFVAAEAGLRFLDVPSLEPSGWSEVKELLLALANDSQGYESLVIDSIDHLEPMIWDYVCKTYRDDAGRKHDAIPNWPYGQGYKRAVGEWRELLKMLDGLTEKMNVVLIAHTHIKKYQNPSGEDYDRYEIKLQGSAAALLVEWSDCVAFATFHDLISRMDGRAKVTGSGERVMHLQRRPAWDAKCRWPVPATLPLNWWELMKHMQGSLAFQIDQLASELSDDVQKKVNRSFERVASNKDLSKLLDWVRIKGENK